MSKAKEFYLQCLKGGPMRHDYVAAQLKTRFNVAAAAIRDSLIASGHIKQSGVFKRKDGKRVFIFELTGKEFGKSSDTYNQNWEDGTPKSRGNAFDWRNYAKGMFTVSEIAAVEAGRKWGINTANKKILPRASI